MNYVEIPSKGMSAPLFPREKWSDGRWKAVIGDKVYQAVRGFGGSAAYINGEVCGRKNLRVKITGTASLIGGGYRGPKTVKYDHYWTVVGDPRPEEVKAAREAEAAKRDQDFRNELIQNDETGKARAKAAIEAGDKPLTPETFKPGLIVMGHRPFQEGEHIAAEMHTFSGVPTIFFNEIGDPDEAPRSAPYQHFTIPQPERFAIAQRQEA